MVLGELGSAFSFGDYGALLAREAAMDPTAMATVRTAVLGSLAAGSLILLLLTVLRRSGTAAAGFALLVLTGLSQAILFGSIDFITGETRLLIAVLNASALLLFVNAVLHTGRENVLLAGLSALVIAALLGLGGATMAGYDLGLEARAAIIVGTALSGALLLYGLVRDPRGKAVMVLSVFLSLLASAMMTDALVPMVSSALPAAFPSILASVGLILATVAAPFIGEDVQMASGKDRRAADDHQFAPVSLFDDDEGYSDGRPSAVAAAAVTTAAAGGLFGAGTFGGGRDEEPEERLAPEPAPQATFDRGSDLPVPAAASFDQGSDPVSNHWHQDAGGVILEAEADEYVWDALAQPEVRCGNDVLGAFGSRDASALTLEGLRERLDPASLDLFDGEVLGGGEPTSGPFEVALATSAANFTFRGRRKVDHDGILMRVDGAISDVAKIAAPTPAAAPALLARPGRRHDVPVLPVVRLSGGDVHGVEAELAGVSDAETAKERIDAAAAALMDLLRGGAKGGFVLVDTTVSELRPGILASSAAKAMRAYELPRGSMVIGLPTPTPREVKSFMSAANDISAAGANVAVMLDDVKAKLPKGFVPDMVWASARDALRGKRGRGSVIAGLAKRHDAPIVIKDVASEADGEDANNDGATYAVGRAYAGLTIGSGAAASGYARFGDAPGGGTEGGQNGRDPLSSLRANGLR